MTAAMAMMLVALTACTAVHDDKPACQKYASVLSDWAVSGNSDAVAAEGVALKLRTEVIPLASAKLAAPMKVIAKTMDASQEQPGSAVAGKQIKTLCAAAGVKY